MEYIKHEDIAHEAYRIWQKRKTIEDPEADNAKENWRRAEEKLEKRELERTWKLGKVGHQ